MLFTRVALLSAMLTSKKSSDGYSKLIFKSDFDRLTRALQSKAVQMESILAKSWAQLVQESIDGAVKATAFGKLCVRTVLLVLQKQKYGRDPEFDSFTDITNQFAEDLAGGNPAPSPAQSSKQRQEQEKRDKVEDLVSASAAQVAMLQHAHLKIGFQHLSLDFWCLFLLMTSSVICCSTCFVL